LETVQRDFSEKGVKFYYIYKALAHPETNGYITPFTLQERLMHVAEAKKKLGSRITWLCDTMANDAKHGLGDAPNSEFIIGPDGKFVKVRRWSRPDELRADLEELVGVVENPTSIADIGMKRLEPAKTAPKGIVARLQLPGRMTSIKVQPSKGLSLSTPPLADDLTGGEPLYVKLRAEVDSQYFQEGKGKLYLGFFLDPLYEVHWNNQVAPVAYEIEAPEGVEITPLEGNGPKVEEKADADPREFLLELSGESQDPIRLTVKYFACDDADTFCKAVTQHYLVTVQRDRDGGSRRGGGRPPGSFAGRPFGGATASSTSADEEAARRSKNLKAAVAIFREHDANEDGKIDKSELARVENVPADSDADKDGLVSLGELVAAINAQSTPSRDFRSRAVAQRDIGDVLLAALDTDGDGALSTDELASVSQSLRTLDRNSDGQLTPNEIAPAPAGQRGGRFGGPPGGFGGGRPNPAEMLTRMDANGDGKVSKSEVPQQMLQRWDRMDTNSDGFIDKKELEQLAERFRGFSRGGSFGNRPGNNQQREGQRPRRPPNE
jgi:Ca2+-binding EF-hand superfamily protein